MPQIFNNKYKEVVERILAYDLPLLDKVTLVLEELCEAKDEHDDMEYDYGTIAKAVIETCDLRIKNEL